MYASSDTRPCMHACVRLGCGCRTPCMCVCVCRFHAVSCGGAIGTHRLSDDALRLDAVVEPPSVAASAALPTRFFAGLGAMFRGGR